MDGLNLSGGRINNLLLLRYHLFPAVRYSRCAEHCTHCNEERIVQYIVRSRQIEDRSNQERGDDTDCR